MAGTSQRYWIIEYDRLGNRCGMQDVVFDSGLDAFDYANRMRGKSDIEVRTGSQLLARLRPRRTTSRTGK